VPNTCPTQKIPGLNFAQFQLKPELCPLRDCPLKRRAWRGSAHALFLRPVELPCLNNFENRKFPCHERVVVGVVPGFVRLPFAHLAPSRVHNQPCVEVSLDRVHGCDKCCHIRSAACQVCTVDINVVKSHSLSPFDFTLWDLSNLIWKW
jgi:hypothetical protein